ncbi:hypothetical protein [Acetatifactor aquisgranensis]|nr:hypothetical protein [Acetatifactor aquisgranensis]
MNQGNVRMCGVHFKLALENQDSVNLTYPMAPDGAGRCGLR